jgi:hypothetical protein
MRRPHGIPDLATAAGRIPTATDSANLSREITSPEFTFKPLID